MGAVCEHGDVSERTTVIRVRERERFVLPELDAAQRAVVEAAVHESLVVLGAPGSGRTTTALAVLAGAVGAGEDVLLVVPDRVREDRLAPVASQLAPAIVRPVRTPTALAFSLVKQWRLEREEPLGGTELVTGAGEDRLIAEALAEGGVAWPESLPEEVRLMPAFRMEMRNLFARAAEAGLDAEALHALGRAHAQPQWCAAAEVLARMARRPEAALEHRGVMRATTAEIQVLAARLLADGEGAGPTASVPALVIVDDLQDCTAATIDLLAGLASRGTRIVALADPDVGVATYRGGEPQLHGRLAERLGCRTLDLGPVHRGTEQLREVARTVAGRIGISGTLARRAVGVAGEARSRSGGITAHLVAGEAQMGALVARMIRESHLLDGTPWEQHAVIARSSGAVESMKRHLRRAGVPLSGGRRAVDFAAEPVPALLLSLIRSGMHPENRDAMAGDLLTSALGGLDALAVRRVRARVAAVRAAEEERPEGGDPSLIGDVELLDVAATRPELFVTPSEEGVPGCAGLGRVWALAPTLAHLSPGVALWRLWEAFGVAEEWRQRALDGDADSPWFDDQLDLVLALFRVADVWEQRNEGGRACDFADEVLHEGVPVDTLARAALRPPGVSVLTPAQAVGGQWECVHVVGLQDGIWPNPTLRDRILRSTLLTTVARGAGELEETLGSEVFSAREQVRHDETRMFLAAITRATRTLGVHAVSAEDEAPSAFFDLVNGHASPEGGARPDLTAVPPPLDVHGVIGRLRHLVATTVDEPFDGVLYEPPAPGHAPRTDRTRRIEGELATVVLALLDREGIAAASPRRWGGVGGVTSSDPMSSSKAHLSPSKLESILRCPLRAFFSSTGCGGPSGDSQELGTFLHALAEDFVRDELRTREARERLNAIGAGEDPATRLRRSSVPGGEDVVAEGASGTRAEAIEARLLARYEEWALERGWDTTRYGTRTLHDRGAAKVKRLARFLAETPLGREVRVEERIHLETDEFILSGRVDRIDLEPITAEDEVAEGAEALGAFHHRARVIDYKSGAPISYADADSHPQLAAYQLALAAAGIHVDEAVLAFLGGTSGEGASTRAQGHLDAELREAWLDVMNEAVMSMRGPGVACLPEESMCRTCEFATACPAQDAGRRTLE